MFTAQDPAVQTPLLLLGGGWEDARDGPGPSLIAEIEG